MTTRARHVVVVGGGVAGVAAAFAAKKAGAEVSILSRGPGASSFMSGAIDDRCWELDQSASPHPDSDPAGTLAAFFDALGLWELRSEWARVLTCWGISRSAVGRDRAVLNLSALRDACVVVPRVPRQGWNADLLARTWSADPWSLSRGIRYEAIDLPLLEEEHERWMRDADLAAKYDDAERLSRVASALSAQSVVFDAVVFGPWLGVTTNAAGVLSEAVNRPVGEALTLLGGTCGRRFERAVDRLLTELGIERIDAFATSVELMSGTVEVRHEASAEPIRGSAVVLACGGLVGGGVEFCPPEATESGEWTAGASEPYRLSCRTPCTLMVDGRMIDAVGSMHGPNLEVLAWPSTPDSRSLLESVCVRHHELHALDHEGRELPRVFVAGEISAGEVVGVLYCARTGITSGDSASCL